MKTNHRDVLVIHGHCRQPFVMCKNCEPRFPQNVSRTQDDRKKWHTCTKPCTRSPSGLSVCSWKPFPFTRSDQTKRSERTYSLHIHSLLQLQHHTVDALLQERPSARVSLPSVIWRPQSYPMRHSSMSDLRFIQVILVRCLGNQGGRHGAFRI
ncbi:hypothetical protein BDV40DRAFT_188588 [Aspergillus tamarii]|uniref:Uncharacterized protein n=1 Tax=Aspergillus tamarii TaxID=41984 RepID=A0A5N6V855_ASPTM|nr:hypothetical protein BDV40DRAFT_188588 [Aspergillus tamarii]